MNPKVLVSGSVVARFRRAECGGVIIRTEDQNGSSTPAYNSFVLIELGSSARARYLPWVNLFDIEHAAKCEPGRWSLVEPTEVFAAEVLWLPFGWGSDPLPSVAA
jgi:hypothetical protein